MRKKAYINDDPISYAQSLKAIFNSLGIPNVTLD